MKFTPFKFQIPLAAGGVALMAFNYMQFAVPHGKGLIRLSDMSWSEFTAVQTSLYLLMLVIMLVFSVINLGSTVIFLKELAQWLVEKVEYQEFMESPPTKSIGIFVPVASLSMTANVILAPMAFFVPILSSNLQSMMLPGLIFFGLLWLAVFILEFRALKAWLSHPLDVTQLNFIWLLDVFAFGLVSLTGTGIAALCSNKEIASIAAFSSLFTLSLGVCLFVTKLAYLIYLQIKASRLPEKPILPAFFLVIPITCLFGFSFYRIMLYLQIYFSLDTRMLSFVFINVSYVITIGWGVFCLYLLSVYFKEDFLTCDFFPTQWGLV
ncbi:MAG: hypothetical protein HY888_07695 [Deltaproteobacteria bacterium]|nr:hypothetical protein [Deltaproteobacteria bacterium]